MDSTTLSLSDKGELTIPIKEISNKASFYQFELEGTKMEVVAVKASDDTIRTSFNTCQICYSSGKGYFIQDGTDLVCQNCKNHFSIDNLEKESGGCNPVPIPERNKVVNKKNITLKNDILAATKPLFLKWKK